MLSASMEMLRDLSMQVLGYVGCPDEAAQATAAALTRAVVEASSSGAEKLGLTFRADTCTLDIVLSSGQREVWRTSRVIA
jgi:hypothetical protein